MAVSTKVEAIQASAPYTICDEISSIEVFLDKGFLWFWDSD